MNPKQRTRAALNKAINMIGLINLAAELKISYQSVRGWELRGTMPRTEYNCETSYSQTIENLTGGKVKVEDLLGHRPACMTMKEAV